MTVLDGALGDRQTYATTSGGSRLDLILSDLDDLPKTKDFPQENLDRLLAMLDAPVTEYGHRELWRIIRHVCAAVGVDDRELAYQNVAQWRHRNWGNR